MQDIIIQNNYGCTDVSYIAMTMILSIIVGFIWSSFVMSVASDLTYHTDYITSNKEVCSMPSEQKFKCKVYKNGELITTMSK